MSLYGDVDMTRVMFGYRALATCHDCDWQGRRRWPSPPRPCPRCRGTVRRVLPGRGDRRDVAWTD